MDFNLSTIISLAALALGLAIILYLVGTIAADVDHFKRRYSRYRELRRMERVVRTELKPGGRLAASSSLESSSSESVCS